MRAICRVRLDTVRPALILTREVAVPFLSGITVAPITSRIRGIATEVPVGRANGLDRDGVVNCDTIMTVLPEHIGEVIGYLPEAQEQSLELALRSAFDVTSRRVR